MIHSEVEHDIRLLPSSSRRTWGVTRAEEEAQKYASQGLVGAEDATLANPADDETNDPAPKKRRQTKICI